ncbi:MAG: hypothetical protein D6808_07495 [Candidatus Dadabacteria bacterium]|nr:MAG: hypothetical protein D6808_07495 [Candidatus Dadabacteria bacterium]
MFDAYRTRQKYAFRHIRNIYALKMGLNASLAVFHLLKKKGLLSSISKGKKPQGPFLKKAI